MTEPTNLRELAAWMARQGDACDRTSIELAAVGSGDWFAGMAVAYRDAGKQVRRLAERMEDDNAGK